jgi:hypothetical protein
MWTMGSLREPFAVPPDRKPTRLVPAGRGGTAGVSYLQTTAGNTAVQRLLTDEAVLQRYRKKGSMNFGAADNGTLIEQEFKSMSKQPWISLITVVFDSVVKDSNGVDTPMGTATAAYFSNKHALGSFSVSVNGGPRGLRSDPGTFFVHRIEGLGYNDAANAAQIAADKGVGALEGPKRGAHRRYTKPGVGETPMDVSASMHLAVFYNRGEALHMGPLDLASHGCVHVANSDIALLTQLNYHSVIGLTKVKVSYTGPAKVTFTR